MLQRNKKTGRQGTAYQINMSLEKITLPESLITTLYTAPLIALQNPKAGSNPHPADIRYLGSNKKCITVLVKVADASYLSENDFSFLTGILTACKLNMADIAIVNLHPLLDTRYQTIQSVTHPDTVLMFGVLPEEIELPLNFPNFQVQPFNNTTYVCAPSLDRLATDTTLKGQLWACLKLVFRL